MFRVEHYTMCDGWISNETTVNEKGKEVPVTYNTKQEAQASIDEFFKDIEDDIRDGHRDKDDGYDREEFQIAKVSDNVS